MELISELYDTPAFETTFEISKGSTYEYETREFEDSQQNKIKVGFYQNDQGFYEVDFTVNGDSFQSAIKYSLRDYSALLATVAQAVNQFIQQYHPLGIELKANNIVQKIRKNPKAENQKGRLYQYFVTQIQDNGKYSIDAKDPMNIKLTIR